MVPTEGNEKELDKADALDGMPPPRMPEESTLLETPESKLDRIGLLLLTIR